MSIDAKLLEVYRNGAMPKELRPFREMNRDYVWYEMTQHRETPLLKTFLVDLARIGMADWLNERNVTPSNLTFDHLFELCQLHADWKQNS